MYSDSYLLDCQLKNVHLEYIHAYRISKHDKLMRRQNITHCPVCLDNAKHEGDIVLVGGGAPHPRPPTPGLNLCYHSCLIPILHIWGSTELSPGLEYGLM